MSLGKFLILLVALAAIVAIVELVVSPRPTDAPNRRVNGSVYGRIMPGMSEKQIEVMLGPPHEIRCGEVVKFEEPESKEVGFEIVEKPVRPNLDILNIYRGLKGERILVLLEVGRRTATGVGYSVEDVPVLYKGHSGARDKAISPLAIGHPMSQDVQDKVYRFLLDWSLHKDKSSPPPVGIISWERRSNAAVAIVPPPPPPPPVAEPSDRTPPAPAPPP
jgi:hypothetical protein